MSLSFFIALHEIEEIVDKDIYGCQWALDHALGAQDW
jgi:hypothetical protein